MSDDISLTHGPFTSVKISHKSDRLKNTDTAVQEARVRLGALLKDDDAAAYYPGMPEDVRAILASEAALREENERLREALAHQRNPIRPVSNKLLDADAKAALTD